MDRGSQNYSHISSLAAPDWQRIIRLLTQRLHKGNEKNHNYFPEDPLARAVIEHPIVLSFNHNDE